MPDDVIFCDELTDPDADRTLRITVDRDGCVYVTVETQFGPLHPATIIGGEALLMWLQAQSEAANFALHRLEQREAA
jgi:hypothetical protein